LCQAPVIWLGAWHKRLYIETEHPFRLCTI
jgi:hypothetical protein